MEARESHAEACLKALGGDGTSGAQLIATDRSPLTRAPRVSGRPPRTSPPGVGTIAISTILSAKFRMCSPSSTYAFTPASVVVYLQSLSITSQSKSPPSSNLCFPCVHVFQISVYPKPS